MEERILIEAKKDLPLYFNDFKNFWDETLKLTKDSDLVDCYANILLFKNWKLALNASGINNLDDILDEIHEDINASFFYSLLGQYRSAHMHLRSIIQLSLQLIYFYQHEVEYEQWRSGDFRIKHEELSNYLKKHPRLHGEKTGKLIETLTLDWKNFSKHIHAETPLFFQASKMSKKNRSYNKADAGIWRSNFLNTGYRVNKLLLTFFKTNLPNFPHQNRFLLLRNMKSSDLALLDIIP